MTSLIRKLTQSLLFNFLQIVPCQVSVPVQLYVVLYDALILRVNSMISMDWINYICQFFRFASFFLPFKKSNNSLVNLYLNISTVLLRYAEVFGQTDQGKIFRRARMQRSFEGQCLRINNIIGRVILTY